MKFHGIQLQEGTVVTNMTVAIGVSFPETPSVGELFFRSDADQNVRGMYIYGGTGWDRVGTTEVLTSPTGLTLPSEANTGDLFYLNTNDAAEGLYVFNGGSWVKANGTPDNTSSVTGDVSGTVTLGSISTLSLATILAPVIAKGSASKTVTVSVDSKGRVTSVDEQNIAIDAAQVTSGTFANGRISQTSVTQHQGSLLLAASQINSGTFADSRISQSNVTQHQSALTLSESQILDGALLARVGANENISGSWSFDNPITGQDPTAGVHLATKAYVDTVAAGLDPKGSVKVATTENISLSGSQLIDGVAISAGQRILVKDQTDATQNGIYVSAAGAWARASDADSSAKVTPGIFFMVEEGATNADSAWVLVNDGAITLGTTQLNFVRFNGTGQIEAGQGIDKNGNTLSLAQLADSGAGSLLKISRDVYGRISGTSPVTAADLSPILDAQYVNANGDTLTGALTVSSTTADKLVLQHPDFGNASIGSDSAGSMIFKADEANSQPATAVVWRTDGVERMRIDTSGNFGVGTSSPAAALHVHASGAVGTDVAIFSSPAANARLTVDTLTDGSGIALDIRQDTPAAANKSLAVSVNGTEALRVDASRNVGIGTSAPASKLHVIGSNAILILDRTGSESAVDFRVGGIQAGQLRGLSAGGLRFTDGSAGTEWARFSSTGNFGVGTSNPGWKLDVAGGSIRVQNDNGLRIAGTTTADLTTNASGVTLNAVNAGAAIMLQTQSTERMRIDSSGNVGIGAAEPLRPLSIHNTNAQIQFTNATTGTTISDGLRIGLGGSDSADAFINLLESANLIFNTGGTERVRIGSTGNMGVGSSYGMTRMDVATVASAGTITDVALFTQNTQANPTTGQGVRVYLAASASTNRAAAIEAAVSNGLNGHYLAFLTNTPGAAPTERMRVDSGGNVGIGTSSPGAALDIANGQMLRITNDAALIRLRSSTTPTNFGEIAIDSSGTTYFTSQTGNVFISAMAAAGQMFFRTGGGVERMRIDANGNLGVGTSSPSSKLEVSNGTNSNGALKVSATGTSAGNFASMNFVTGTAAWTAGTEANSGRFFIYNNAGTTDQLNFSGGANSNAGISALGTGSFVINTAGLERVRVNASGNVGIGTTAPSAQGLSVIKSGATDAGVQVGNGTASTYLTQSADGNFYLYNYGAYGLVFGTGGAEKMRLNASGNLGLGVTPSTWSTGKAFEVGAAGNSLFGPSANEINLTQNAFFNAGWKYGSTQTAGRYQIQGGVHLWFTAPSGTAGADITFTEAMTLDASGNLGIGTTPAYKLDVDHGGSPVRFRNGTTGYGSIALGGSATATNNYQLASDGSGNLIVYRGNPGSGTERLRVDVNGNLGVGSTAPTNYTGSGYGSIAINGTTGGILEFQGAGTQAARITGWSNSLAVHTNNVERLRIDSNGNLGLGTGTPVNSGRALTLYNTETTGLSAVHLQNATSGNTTADGFALYANGTDGSVWNYESANILFGTGNAERMRLTSAGNLALGASSTTARMLIQGSGAQETAVVQHGGTNHSIINLNQSDALGTNPSFRPILSLRKGGVTSFNLSVDGTTQGLTYFEAYSATAALVFVTNSVERARIDSSGNLLVTGSSGLGYGAGSGGTVTQITNKATGVTLNKPNGTITLNAAALAANTTVSFTLTNSSIAATDVVHVQRASGGTAGVYNVWCDSVAAGSCVICVRNISAGSLSEAVVLQFVVIKSSNS